MTDTAELDTRIFVSVSSLGTWRACPKRYEYQKHRNLTLAAPRKAIDRELGSWWHAVRAADSIARSRHRQEDHPEEIPHYLPGGLTTGDFGPVIPVTLATDTRTVIEAAQEFWDTMDDQLREDWLERTGKPLPEHLVEMDYRWRVRWAEETAHEQIIAVELPLEVKLPGAGNLWFRGRVDEVVRDTRTSAIILRDHKANRDMPVSEAVEDLIDSQLHLYAWAVSLTIGEDVKVLSYDRARSKPAATPKLTLAGGLSKSVTDYDLLKYLDFTMKPVPYPGRKKDGSDAGEYVQDGELVKKLGTPMEMDKWNRRAGPPVNLRLIKAHLMQALVTARQIRDAEEFPRNLSRRGCKGCDFLELCLDEMRTGRVLDNEQDYGLALRQK